MLPRTKIGLESWLHTLFEALFIAGWVYLPFLRGFLFSAILFNTFEQTEKNIALLQGSIFALTNKYFASTELEI